MSGEQASRSEEKLSSGEIITLKDQFRGKHGALNLFAFQVCDQVAESMADRIEATTGQRPGHESEWKFMNSVTRSVVLERAIALPGGEWPDSPGTPAPEEYATALHELVADPARESVDG